MRRRCRQIKTDGSPCSAPPLRDAEYCFAHDPAHADAASEARRLGGLRRRRELTLQGAYDFEGLDTVPKIRRVLEIAVHDVLGADNSIGRAKALSQIAMSAANLLRAGEVEDRLKAIEELLKGRDQSGGRR